MVAVVEERTQRRERVNQRKWVIFGRKSGDEYL